MLTALEINLKAFTRNTRKEPPIPADKNRTLTQIEPSMPKQVGGGALWRAAAPLFSHVPLCCSQRLISIMDADTLAWSRDEWKMDGADIVTEVWSQNETRFLFRWWAANCYCSRRYLHCRASRQWRRCNGPLPGYDSLKTYISQKSDINKSAFNAGFYN